MLYDYTCKNLLKKLESLYKNAIFDLNRIGKKYYKNTNLVRITNILISTIEKRY